MPEGRGFWDHAMVAPNYESLVPSNPRVDAPTLSTIYAIGRYDANAFCIPIAEARGFKRRSFGNTFK